MDLLRGVTPQVQPLLLLAMLIEEHQVRIAVRDEVHLQAHVGVSMPGLFDEAPSLRQLVQASARAALDLRTPSSIPDGSSRIIHVLFCGLQAHVEELHQVVRLPVFDIRPEHAGPVAGLQLDGRPGAGLVVHLQIPDARSFPLDEVMQILVSLLLSGICNESGLWKELHSSSQHARHWLVKFWNSSPLSFSLCCSTRQVLQPNFSGSKPCARQAL
eukprot:CAMPEP_0181396810 /NCGR_PEP_ID=MMETSP1110-20121109/113_1 /TAXON_ID=174948 /ORGANISM="Symbiodinium sp., Strain CCMP421" /LENGTH=214 /DNA_ID=CAMNT_0023518533 /DNA_START=265 /DNA_END=905 /DNA_ORIENTATION=-